jgi:hypothetical protein
MAIPAADSRAGMLQLLEGSHLAAVGKADIARGHALCRTVASRGVAVLVLR